MTRTPKCLINNLAQHFGSADFISYNGNNCKFALQDDITEHKLLASPLSKILLNTPGIILAVVFGA